jgi:hypothetical protein
MFCLLVLAPLEHYLEFDFNNGHDIVIIQGKIKLELVRTFSLTGSITVNCTKNGLLSSRNPIGSTISIVLCQRSIVFSFSGGVLSSTGSFPRMRADKIAHGLHYCALNGVELAIGFADLFIFFSQLII